MKLGDAKPQTRGEHSRLEDLVDTVKFKNGHWMQVRILPSDIVSYRQHWINILTPKTKREVRIPKMCIAHNTTTEELDGDECPYCDVEAQTSTSYLVNVIVRSLQDDAPAKIRVTKGESASGFKDPKSESWTPVRVLRLTSGLMKKIQELKALNKHKLKIKGNPVNKTFDVNHEKYGVDLNIKYDENAKGPEKYQINMAEKTALQEDELQYLQYELNDDLVQEMGRDSTSEAKKELSRMQIVGAEEFGDDDDDDDDSVGKKKKSANGKPAAKGKKSANDDDDDDDGYGDDDDDDDEPPAKKKAPAKKPVAKGKKKPADDEDEDDGFDDDDDDDDDEPPARSKKPAAKGKKKPADEDDEDDGFDDDDDEPPARSKKPVAKSSSKKPAAKGKKSVRDDDDDDDDGFDDDDDDEDDEDDGDDEPPARSKKPVAKGKKPAAKAPAKKPAAKGKKKPADDEDEDDEDDGFDDDDDDEAF